MRTYTIGRDSQADVVIPPKHSQVSRMHARVTELTSGRYRIEDLGSTAGTFVRCETGWNRVSHAHVDPRDTIRLGNLETSIDALIGTRRARKSDPPRSNGHSSYRGLEIFISYARTDIEHVRPLVALFEEQGWSVFWDRKIDPGQQWSIEIEQALAAAKLVIVVWSRASVRSEWVKAEAMAARERQALLPVRIEDAAIPLPFNLVQTTDLSAITSQSDQKQAVRQLLNAVGRMIEKTNRPEPSSDVAAGLFRAEPTYSGLNFARAFFDLNGRLNRLHSFLGTLVLMVLGFTLNPMVTAIVSSVSTPTNRLEALIATSIFTAMVLIYPAVCIYVKRLHDVDFSGYWAVPIVVMGLFQEGLSIGFLVMDPSGRAAATNAYLVILAALSIPVLTLMLWPGNRSANKFGPPPRR